MALEAIKLHVRPHGECSCATMITARTSVGSSGESRELSKPAPHSPLGAHASLVSPTTQFLPSWTMEHNHDSCRSNVKCIRLHAIMMFMLELSICMLS